MADPTAYLIPALAGFATIIVVALIGLQAFSRWLELKRDEVGMRRPTGRSANIEARIDIADLKERIRKLEAIASEVDL